MYETPPQNLKKAQQDLKDFLDDRFLTDMESTKEAEKKILEERIENWQKYLDMLEQKKNEANRIQEEHLLEEMLGVKSEEEIYNILQSDMTNFVAFLEANNINTKSAYDGFNSVFSNFLTQYKNNVLQLQQLQQQQIQLMNAQQYLQANNSLYKMPGLTYTPSANNWTGATNSYSNLPTSAPDWSAVALAAASSGNRVLAEHAFKQRQIKLNSRTPEQNALALSKWTQEDLWSEIQKRLNGYANGIENGPITNTGITMVHGTESNPEYVLNNEQAYQLLKNFATKDLNIPTASLGDESPANIGYTGRARSELEGINILIDQMSNLISTESDIKSSELAQMLNILNNLNSTQSIIQEIASNDFTQDNEFYNDLLELLNELFKNLFDNLNKSVNEITPYLIAIQNGLDSGINSIGGLVENISGISQGIVNLGTQIGGLDTAIKNINIGGTISPSYKDIYGDFLNTGLNNPTSVLPTVSNKIKNPNEYPTGIDDIDDWSKEAIKAANDGDKAYAYYCISMRELKIGSAGYKGHGGPTYGTTSNKLKSEVDAILKTKGYATGINKGPVTDTGLTLLHGTPSNPEYVLNNDQAYQLLKNLANEEMEINSSSEGLEKLNIKSNDIIELANAQVDRLNIITDRLSSILTKESESQSMIVQIMNIISNINQYSGLIQQMIADEVVKNDTRFMTLIENLESILEKIDLDTINDSTNFALIESSIDAIGEEISKSMISGLNQLAGIFDSGINNLNQGINSLGTQLSSGLGQLANGMSQIGSNMSNITVPNYTENPGTSNGNTSTGTGNYVDSTYKPSSPPKLTYNNKTDWAEKALYYAGIGDINSAMTCIEFRGRKLNDPEYIAQGGHGNGLSQAELTRKVTEAYNAWRRNGYAEGLENGPVTETGLAMLHGTENKPEYVLNNDQAYQLLKNLSTMEYTEQTASMEDEGTAFINDNGYEGPIKDKIESAISKLANIATLETINNSELAQIINIISNLNSTQKMISNALNNTYIKLDSGFGSLLTILEVIEETAINDYNNDKQLFETINKNILDINTNIKNQISSNKDNTDKNIGNDDKNIEQVIDNIKDVKDNTGSLNEIDLGTLIPDYEPTGIIKGVPSITDNSRNQGGYNNGNTGGNYVVGKDDVPDHYLGPQGEMIYQQTVGGTLAVDSLGNKYDVSEQGEYIKRGIGGGATTERRLDLANTYQYVNGKHYWYDESGHPIPMTADQIRGMGINPIEYKPGERNSPIPNDSIDSTGGSKNKTTALDIHDKRYFDQVYYDEKGREITLDTARNAGLNTIDQYIFKYGAYSIGYRRKPETMNENSNSWNTAPQTGNAVPAGTGGFNNSPYINADQYEKALEKVISSATKDKNNSYTSDKTVTDRPNTSFGSYVGGKENNKVDLNANYTQLAYEAAQNGDRESANRYLELMKEKISQSNYTGTKNLQTVEAVRKNVNYILSVSDQQALSGEFTANKSGEISSNTLKATEQNQELIGTATLTLNSSKENIEATKGVSEAVKTLGGSLGTSLTGITNLVDKLGNAISNSVTNNNPNSGQTNYFQGSSYSKDSDSSSSSGIVSTTNDGRVQWYDKTGGLHTGSQSQYNNALNQGKVNTSSSSSSNKGSSSSLGTTIGSIIGGVVAGGTGSVIGGIIGGTIGKSGSSSSSRDSSNSSSSSSRGSSSSSSSSSSKSSYESKMEKKGYEKQGNAWVHKSNGLRANGIEGGPIDKTGYYTLHGSKSNPEYVLNTQQAYTLLKNISTKDNIISNNTDLQKELLTSIKNVEYDKNKTPQEVVEALSNSLIYNELVKNLNFKSFDNYSNKTLINKEYDTLRNLNSLNMPEIESKFNSQDMTQYVLNGDINLETNTNPGEFWQKVTQSMQMRMNTNKSNR